MDQGPKILKILERSKGEENLPNTDHGVCCLIIRHTSLVPAQELGAARGEKKIKLHQMHSFKKYLQVSWPEVWEHSSEQHRRGSRSHKAHASAVALGKGQSLSQVPSQHGLQMF